MKPDIMHEYHVKHIAQHIQLQYIGDEEREKKVHIKSSKYLKLHHLIDMFFSCYIFLNISFKDSPTEFKVKQHIVGLQPRM